MHSDTNLTTPQPSRIHSAPPHTEFQQNPTICGWVIDDSTNFTTSLGDEFVARSSFTWRWVNWTELNYTTFGKDTGLIDTRSTVDFAQVAYTGQWPVNSSLWSCHCVALCVRTVPAAIIDHLSSDDVTVQEGDTVVLVCNVTGVPTPDVTWFRRPATSTPSDRERKFYATNGWRCIGLAATRDTTTSAAGTII